MGLREIFGHSRSGAVALTEDDEDPHETEGPHGTERITDPLVQALLAGWTRSARAAGAGMLIDDRSVLSGPSELSVDIVTVLGNLVENAVEAAVEGAGPQPGVWVRMRETADSVLLLVSDNGRGVPPGKKSQWIFTSGTTTKQRTGGPDRGLGLWIVQDITRRRGGVVSVAERAGGGTTFTVRLPKGRTAEALVRP
ncbi:sensor histidine kinase [Streptomyces luteogriseus]|uniref:sensor histidine kinase n=1 Tax=Streptomyces luteogriseus TaxID=68233 RepID=UPI0036E2BCE4